MALAPVERDNSYAWSLGCDALPSLIFVTLQFHNQCKMVFLLWPNQQQKAPILRTLLCFARNHRRKPPRKQLPSTYGNTPRDVSSLIFQVNRECNIYRHPQHIITTLESASIAQPQGIICRSSSHGAGMGERIVFHHSAPTVQKRNGTPLRCAHR
jgi:hypothetical protein